MADNYSSADNKISVPKDSGASKLNAKEILKGMPKDVLKRWKIVAVLGFGGMVLAAGWFSSGGAPAPRVSRAPDAASIDTTPKGLTARNDWKAQTGAELQVLKQNLMESTAAQKELLARMDAMRQEMAQLKAGGNAGAVAQGANAPNRLNLTLPPPPEPPKPASVSRQDTSPLRETEAGVPPPVEVPKRSPARAFIPVESTQAAAKAAGARTQEDMVPNERMGYLPAASFADATLISGVEAFTGGTAQSMPQPVVLRLDENAVLPNAAHYQIKGCHVLASVWGDMSSERVFGRLATLTCVDAHNKLVLSEEVEGTLVDSDGKNGIRGVLQDRQGAKLARSLLAGFAQGMSSAFGMAQNTVSTGVLGTTSTLTGGNAAAAAGYQGANNAAQSLAQYYLKQAEATMPVIAVDAGRKVSVLFTKSKALRFETTDAYRVKPKTSFKVERSVQ